MSSASHEPRIRARLRAAGFGQLVASTVLFCRIVCPAREEDL
jgi:methylphosphotriester-DNA--protein-cysteine methyltransferase